MASTSISGVNQPIHQRIVIEARVDIDTEKGGERRKGGRIVLMNLTRCRQHDLKTRARHLAQRPPPGPKAGAQDFSWLGVTKTPGLRAQVRRPKEGRGDQNDWPPGPSPAPNGL